MDKTFFQQEYLKLKAAHNWKLTILILCWEYPPNIIGGLSRHVFGLSVKLAEMGHDVHVITAKNGGTSTSQSFETMNGVKVHRVKPINEQDENFLSWIGGLNLAMASKAEKLTEVPIGAVIVLNGEIIARAHNLRETNQSAGSTCSSLLIEPFLERSGAAAVAE